MAMNAPGRRGHPVSAINVTPMIDVLLVLLIVFMVLQDQLRRGLALQVPPAPDAAPVVPEPHELVLEVRADGSYALNRAPVAGSELRARLAGVLAGRARKVLFVRGDEGVPYGRIVAAVDESRAAGATVIGLVPRR